MSRRFTIEEAVKAAEHSLGTLIGAKCIVNTPAARLTAFVILVDGVKERLESLPEPEPDAQKPCPVCAGRYAQGFPADD